MGWKNYVRVKISWLGYVCHANRQVVIKYKNTMWQMKIMVESLNKAIPQQPFTKKWDESLAHNHLSQIQRNIKSKNEIVGRKTENLNLDKDGNIQWKLVKSMNSEGPSMNKQQLNKETPCLQRRKRNSNCIDTIHC